MASVLLVEDEALIRMMIADMLLDLGHSVAGEASNLASGLSIARTTAADCAILDVSLGADSSAPIAEILNNRGVPFTFASGYGSDGIPAGFRERPVLRKPFTVEELARCLTILLK
ncbi:CheY-like chemotaxis protein [Bradyrhizobium huanghuaihaiense]|uniref:response regulator n=1 Tax=Bradyrhizobium huanghuaihaiense TaxID=990078 RepID=UPI0003695F27|nr:response regulator [Bradyrhizobium huanghuaihaiense]